jgi:hypothetical protein
LGGGGEPLACADILVDRRTGAETVSAGVMPSLDIIG